MWYRYVIDEELIEEALPRSPPCDFSRFGFDLGAGDCLRIFGIWILFVRLPYSIVGSGRSRGFNGWDLAKASNKVLGLGCTGLGLTVQGFVGSNTNLNDWC